jgi:hypothetical protein
MKENEIAGHLSCTGDMRNPYTIPVGMPEGKRSFGRPRSRREENFTVNFEEIIYEAAGLIHLAQDKDQWRALVNTL